MERPGAEDQQLNQETLSDIAYEYLDAKTSALRTTIIWGGIRAGATAGAFLTIATHGSDSTPLIGQSFSMIYRVSDAVGLNYSSDQLTSFFKKTLPIFGYLNVRDLGKLYFQRKSTGILRARIDNAQNAHK